MNEIQESMLEMMIDIDKALKSANIQYFLDSGNAIGAIRHKGFIPWDDDVDIVIKKEDVKKFEETIAKMDGYYLQKPLSIDWIHSFYKVRKNGTTAIEKLWQNSRMHQGIFVDVFVMENYPDSPTARKLYDFIMDKYDYTIRKLRKHIKTHGYKQMYYHTLVPIIKLMNIVLDIITPCDCEYVTQRTIFKKYKTYPKKWIESTVDFEYEGKKFPLCIGYDEVLKKQYKDYMQLPPVEKRTGHHIIYFSKNIDYKDYLAELKQKQKSN